MKFKAKETSKNKITNEIWIIKDKVYDLKEDAFYNEEYIFKSEVSDHHHVPKKDLQKWFEAVEEVKKPRICEILGVEVDEEFKLSTGSILLDNTFYINDNGYLVNDKGSFTPSIGIDIINGNFIVFKLPKYTDEVKGIFKALKVLGFGWIARDINSGADSLYAFNKKPFKSSNVWINKDKMYNLNNSLFDFIKWEDKEPFEIPNISIGGNHES